MTDTITSLIEKLEGAEVGDQDLSLEVNLALEGGEAVSKMTNYTMEPYWAIRRPNSAYIGGFENGPNYPVTTSLDAALALAARVLPRWGWDIGYPARLGEHGGRPWADCWPPVEDGEVAPFRLGGPRPTPRHVNAATPALAVVASLLRAQSEAR